MMNKQHTFDDIVAALEKQGCKSGDIRHDSEHAINTFDCRYRDSKGNKCAIGHLIKDEFYPIVKEGFGVKSYSTRDALEMSLDEKLDRNDLDFLSDMQHIHDEIGVENWDSNFRHVAKKWALEYKGTQY